MKGWAILSALSLSSLLACARDDTVAMEPASRTPRLSEPTLPARAPTSERLLTRAQAPAMPDEGARMPSIYDLEVRLTDQSAVVRSLAAFRGHPVLITMFYGGCPAACPLLTSDLRRIERQLPESVRSNVRVLMVSFDAARDTPGALSRLMTERGMDAARWTLASAPDDEARELAGVLDIRYRRLDNGEFFHSSAIVLLDAQGRPRARVDGIGGDVSVIVSALAKPLT
jgi:protein SCO1/2